MKFPDISDYYIGDLAANEEAAWNREQPHAGYAAHVHAAMDKYGFTKVIELGCGSGMVAKEIRAEAFYLGVDKNTTFFDLAKSKNPDRLFVFEDIRSVDQNEAFLKHAPFDISTSWAVLKHFGLHEWDEIYGKMLSLAKCGVHCLDFTTDDIDDGIAFHHTAVNESRALKVIEKAGHEVVRRVPHLTTTLANGQPLYTTIVTTLKR